MQPLHLAYSAQYVSASPAITDVSLAKRLEDRASITAGTRKGGAGRARSLGEDAAGENKVLAVVSVKSELLAAIGKVVL